MERKIWGNILSLFFLFVRTILLLGPMSVFCPSVEANSVDIWQQEMIGADYVLKAGTVYGATTVTGQIGNALQFNGETDYISVPDNSSLDLTSNLSFAAWIKPGTTQNGNSGTILTKNKEGSYSYYWAIGGGTTTNSKKFAIYLGGVSPAGWQFSTSDLQAGEWIHIVTTFDGSTVKHYINGTLDNTISGLSGTINTNSQPLTIGQRTDYLNNTYQFNGIIDEILLLDKVLSETEIAQLYQDGLNGTGKCTDGNGVCVWTGGEPTGDIYYNSGNVGIGTANPNSKLEVEGTIHSTTGGIKFPDGSIQTTAVTSGVIGDGNSLNAADGSPTDAVFVDNDGNVGIGTTTPSSKLEVFGSIRSTIGGFIFPDGTAQITAASGNSLNAANGSPVDAVFVDGDGNVGIGTTSPTDRLEVQGIVKASAFVGDGAGLINLPSSTYKVGRYVHFDFNTDSHTITTNLGHRPKKLILFITLSSDNNYSRAEWYDVDQDGLGILMLTYLDSSIDSVRAFSEANTNQIGKMIFQGYGTYTFTIETFDNAIRINKTSGYGRGGEIYIVWYVE